MRLGLRRNIVLGVDIVVGCIRAVALERKAYEWKLLDYAVEPLNSEEHESVNFKAAIFEFKYKKIVVALPYSGVETRRIELSGELHDNEIQRYIYQHIYPEWSVHDNKRYMDYIVEKEKGSEKAVVTVLAAERSLVESRLATLRGLKYRQLAVDIESFALARAITDGLADNEKSGLVAINMRDDQFLLVCLYEKRVLFSGEYKLYSSDVNELVNQAKPILIRLKERHYFSAKWLVVSGNKANNESLKNQLAEKLELKIKNIELSQKMRWAKHIKIDGMREHEHLLVLAFGLALHEDGYA